MTVADPFAYLLDMSEDSSFPPLWHDSCSLLGHGNPDYGQVGAGLFPRYPGGAVTVARFVRIQPENGQGHQQLQ